MPIERAESPQGKCHWTRILGYILSSIAAVVLLTILIGACAYGYLVLSIRHYLDPNRHLSGHHGAETVLPAEKAEFVYAFPDGRRVLFRSVGDTLVLLDIASGQEVMTFSGIHQVYGIGDESAYGFGTPPGVSCEEACVIAPRQRSIVWLQTLSSKSLLLPQHIRDADDVLVIGDQFEGLLLLLKQDSAGNVTGGDSVRYYYADYVDNLSTLLAEVPHVTLPSVYSSTPPYQKHSSRDGQFYFTCTGNLVIYSQQGELLNSISTPHTLRCYGWAWDNRGVLFQEQESRGGLAAPVWGPLELLPASP